MTPRLTGELRPCVTDGDSDVQTGTQISQDPSWHVQHDHLQRRADDVLEESIVRIADETIGRLGSTTQALAKNDEKYDGASVSPCGE